MGGRRGTHEFMLPWAVRRIVFALGAFWAVFSSVTAAAQSRAHLEYVRDTGAEKCPDQATLEGAVATRLGYNPFAAEAPTQIRVEIARPSAEAQKGLRARIEMSSGEEQVGWRQLQAPDDDCIQLAQALELAIAIAIDPLGLGAPKPKPPAPTAPPPKPEKPLPRWRQFRLRAQTAALFSVGTAPKIAAGFAFALGIRHKRWSTNLEVRADLNASDTLGGAEVSSRLAVLSAIPCIHQSYFVGCAVITAGASFSRGAGFPIDYEERTPWFSMGIRLGAEFPLGRWVEIHGHADLQGNLVGPALKFDDIVIYASPPASASFHLGLGVFFW